MIIPIFSLISGSTAAKALIGTSPIRFWRDTVPQESQPVTKPYCVWRTIGGAPENYLDGLPGIDSGRVQVDVWASSAASADAVMLAVRNAVEPAAHMISTPTSDYEPDTGLYRFILEFQFWVRR